MNWITLAFVLLVTTWLLRSQEQRRHTLLLSRHLRHFQIERLMGEIIEGSLRALGEDDELRRAHVWGLIDDIEAKLVPQVQRFAESFCAAPPAETRINTLLLPLPGLDKLFPRAGFDMREAVRLHARGIAAVRLAASANDDERRARAFMMAAELMLLQFSCHWFCKSRTVAAVRLVTRHNTPLEQVIDAVSADTRRDYLRLIG